jgi:hypothetical protein
LAEKYQQIIEEAQWVLFGVLEHLHSPQVEQ